MKELKFDDQIIYFNDDAYQNYINLKDTIKKYLDLHLNYLAEITKKVKENFPHLQGFYVSSTYRKPKAKWSPHQEGRAIDVSRFYIEDKPYYLIDTPDREEWKYFAELCGKYFQKGFYNQVLSPFDICDMRRLHVSKIEKLKNSHQDHFHLNIGRNSI